jgi:hypothetical protein
MTLRIYDKHPHADAYALNGGTVYTPYAIVAVEKRFTDAELMAEFHSARAAHQEASKHISLTYWTPLGVEEDATAEMAMKRSVFMLHFAIRPHAHETNYE